MKISSLILALFILASLPTYAKTYSYLVDTNDQLSIILLSLGHKKLWAQSGKVNSFSQQENLEDPSLIIPGTLLKFNDSDILFKKNVSLNDGNILVLRKIKTLNEYDELLENEKIISEHSAVALAEPEKKHEETQVEIKSSENAADSLTLYPGIGGFVANNNEKDRQTTTTTFSGLQPLLQLKMIYSNDSFGGLATDLFAKKILQKSTNFPINFDFRLQFIPKWNFSDSFKFAVSHSMLSHSYMGKFSDSDIQYKVKSNFIGLGLIFLRADYRYEFYIEKAYTGEASSQYSTQQASNGFRVDTEMIYPISEKLKLLPGLNYYHFKQESTQYQLSVFEARLSLTREFEI